MHRQCTERKKFNYFYNSTCKERDISGVNLNWFTNRIIQHRPGFTCRLKQQRTSPTSWLLPSLLSVCCGEKKKKKRRDAIFSFPSSHLHPHASSKRRHVIGGKGGKCRLRQPGSRTAAA